MQNNGLLFSQKTTEQIELFLKKPHHFLLVAAPKGSGKLTAALLIGSRILDLKSPVSLKNHPYFLHINLPENKREIPIEAVRGIIAKLKLKTTGTKTVRRLIVIEDGHYLSEEAQNAFLKTLEEPPEDTQIIMTLESPSAILPTIASRAQIIELQPISLEAAAKHLSHRYDNKKIERSWLLSGGRIGLMQALLNDDQKHELKQAVEQAKIFISKSTYERLVDSQSISQNKEKILLLLDALKIVISTLQRLSIEKQKTTPQAKFIEARKLVEKLKAALDTSVSPRLVYLALCLNLDL